MSRIHFNGVLNKLNNEIKFNSNGRKNNPFNNKFLNGINPGNNSNPRITSSIKNLKPSRSATGMAIPSPSNGPNPPNNADVRIPANAGNNIACNGNLKAVKPMKFNSVNGNVSNPLINGIKNKLIIPLIK